MKKNWKEYLLLTVVFFIIVLVKIYISLRFPTPFIYGDEYLYSYYAKNILSDPSVIIKTYYQYPPGYPIAIIPSFIFYPNMEYVYRSILSINAILSTSVIFVSYIILRKFVEKNLAMLGCILITLLPINTLYSFIIFSENLYISLYLFSGYLIVKSFEKDNRFLHILTGFVIFYLTITRIFGMLTYISFFVVLLYNTVTEKNKKIFIKRYVYLIFVPITLLGSWIITKKIYSEELYGYGSNMYLQYIQNVCNTQNFITFLRLIINEIDYLVAASYFIFFILFILIFLYWNRLDRNIKIYVLYSTSYMILSLILTVFHMIERSNTESYMYYFIWGRYVDPTLSTIFIMGIISLDRLTLYNNSNKMISMSIVTIITFLVTYPYHAMYSIPNVMPIYYIGTKLHDFYSIVIIVIILMISSFIFKKPKFLIIILMIFSILISIPPFEHLKSWSNQRESTNDIGRMLSYEYNESILIDQELPGSADHLLIKFWAMSDNITYGYNFTNLSPNIEYIISEKRLPYEILASSKNVTLYRNNVTIRNNNKKIK